jgi:hypothetical protein
MASTLRVGRIACWARQPSTTSTLPSTAAIPVILATKLQNTGHEVDFAMPWGQGHGGNYDLEQLFDWIEGISG